MKSITLFLSIIVFSSQLHAGIFYNKIYSTCAVLDRMTGEYSVSKCYATTVFFNGNPVETALNYCEKSLSHNPKLSYLSKFRFVGVQVNSLKACESESQKHKNRVVELGYVLREFDLTLIKKMAQ